MEEVIAQSAKIVKRSPKIFLILGVIMLILGIAFLIIPFDNFNALKDYDAEIFAAKLTLLIMGPVFLGSALFSWLHAKNSPATIITFIDGVLKFSDGFSCKIEEISSVRCACNVDYGSDTVLDVVTMGTDSTGALTVVVGGSERVYRNIENVEKANDRLIELMLKSRERTSVMLDYKNDGE